MPNLIKVVVAGDVDSGKSTLIGRYLFESRSLPNGLVEDVEGECKRLGRNFEFAYLLDSFDEERKNELTIDTTQSFCKSGKNSGILFIDVPGHRELLKNMLSGASYADTAVLTIAINKPIREQTKRHAFILKFLGINKIITVINKMDLSGFDRKDFLKIKEQVKVSLGKLKVESCAYIPVSASNGDNLFRRSKHTPWYHGKTLKETIHGIKIKDHKEDLRFLVQDIYDIAGESVAAGIIISGGIKIKNRVFVLPEKKETQIKTIRYSGKKIPSATAPLAAGITIKDAFALRRGQVLSGSRMPPIIKKISGRIICTEDINSSADLYIRCAMQEEKIKITRINHIWNTTDLSPKNPPLKKNDLAEITLSSGGNIVMEKYNFSDHLGRFVIVDGQGKIAAIGGAV
jgi:bifunctional enzyme CysN/CysC/sulfate adenylyltransferase subunit 1